MTDNSEQLRKDLGALHGAAKVFLRRAGDALADTLADALFQEPVKDTPPTAQNSEGAGLAGLSSLSARLSLITERFSSRAQEEGSDPVLADLAELSSIMGVIVRRAVVAQRVYPGL